MTEYFQKNLFYNISFDEYRKLLSCLNARERHFLSGETISGLSTQHTYFSRFRDTWDYMLNVNRSSGEDVNRSSGEDENAGTEDTMLTGLRALPGMESCIAYGLVDTTVSVPEQMLSDPLREAGPETLLGDARQEEISGRL